MRLDAWRSSSDGRILEALIRVVGSPQCNIKSVRWNVAWNTER